MKSAMKLMLVLGTIFSLGCATQRVYVQGDLTGPADYQETQAFWFGGIGQEIEVNASEICAARRSQLSRVEVKQTMKDVILASVTFAIYTPRTVKVSCKK